MRFSSAVALACALATTSASSCTEVSGNYYCSATEKVIFSNVGYSGSYSDITAMDETSGSCSSSSLSFSGNLSPLDEELSVHFRGPIKLVQFGVYYPSSTGNTKRDDDEDCESTTKHAHHKHKRATTVVEVTSIVIVDANGNVITTTASATATVAAASTADAIVSADIGVNKAYRSLSTTLATTTTATSSGASTASTASSAASSSASSGSSTGAWTRSSYYTPGTATNVTFLNNYGGSGSGVWSSTFGNSLSYANAAGTGASSSSVALGDVTVASNNEFVIFSSSSCSDGNSGCGFYRSGTPAFHGFSGKSKIFVFEFTMPTDTSSSYNTDMPAIWLLNAKIPRTLQYGSSSCSCWATGCGELDLFEILSEGSDKLITTLHDGQGANGGSGGGAGSSDYFARPLTGTFKGAAIFTEREIHVMQLDDSVDFGSSLSASVVDAWIAVSGSSAVLG